MPEYIKLDDALSICSQYCADDDGSCSKDGCDPREMLDELEALPAEVFGENDWILCTKELPPDGKSVNVYNISYACIMSAWYDRYDLVWHDAGNDDITYSLQDIMWWRPHPDKPPLIGIRKSRCKNFVNGNCCTENCPNIQYENCEQHFGCDIPEDMGMKKIKCSDCCYNTGFCDDCLLIYSSDCPVYGESGPYAKTYL